MIKFDSGHGFDYEFTEKDFVGEIDSYIKFAVDEEGFQLCDIPAQMIAERLVGRKNHDLSDQAMELIKDSIKNFVNYKVY